jgi:hypothetical protein
MSNQLVEAVLPRLARKLYQELQHLKEGKLSEGQFTEGFEKLLEQQHAWLISQGASEVQAALAIHGAVLVLSTPGLREEATDSGIPLEVLEYRAIRDAAREVAESYDISERKAFRAISAIVVKYST